MLNTHSTKTFSCFLCLLLLAGFLVSQGQGAEEQIDPLLWQGSASNKKDQAHLAFDGEKETRWNTGGSQAVGQWFQVDLCETRLINRIELDTADSAGDYPREYELSLSTDNKAWHTVKKGEGAALTKIELAAPERARYLKVTIPEGSKLSGGFWSIHEFRVFAEPDPAALPRPPVRWRTVQTEFPSRDIVIAGYDIRDFGIDPAKNQDATQAIRLAVSLLAKLGGGTLWLPSGRYRLSEPITLRNNTSIRGDWQKPEPGKPVRGTILEMTANRGEPEAAAGISLYEASAVKGIAFWYPEQKANAIVPYPATLKQFGGVGMAVENVTFVNAYRGFACGPESCALFFLRNLYGTVLETGLKIDSTVDIGRMEMIRFSPRYWSDSGLPDSPVANGPHAAWMKERGTGLLFRRNDWSYAYGIEIEGYQTGLRTLPSLGEEDVGKNRKSYPNGNNARLRFVGCQTAMRLENVAGAGFMVQESEITGCEVGILAEETFTNTLQLQRSRIDKTPLAIRLLGPGQIFATSCEINGTVENPAGCISFAGGKTSTAPNPGNANGEGRVMMLADPGVPDPKNIYTTPEDRIAPPSFDLAVVTDSVYGAKGDGAADDTDAIRRAISAMSAKGGTVFFPAGEYRVAEELILPTGVELRGVNESPHHAQTRGSVIDVLSGRGQVDGKPFITLSAKSGLRGLTFHYPDQDATNIVPYPWMIRGAGEEVWAVNVSCTMAYQLLDLATNRCDRHYIDYVAGHGLFEAFRIGGGSQGGRLLNCQLNGNYYAFTTSYANSPNKMSPKDHGKYMDPVYRYAKDKGRAFVIGDCSGQILFQNFVFGAKQGLVLTGNTGPSGWCLGQGSDQCQWGIVVDRIGPGGMPMLNNQLVTVSDNGPQRGYVRLTDQFKGNAFLYGLDSWGDPSTSLLVEGGKLSLVSAVFSRTGGSVLGLEKSGTAAITDIMMRNADMLVESDSRSPSFQFAGVFLQKDKTLTIYPTNADVPADLIGIKVPGTETGVPFADSDPISSTQWTFKNGPNDKEGARAFDNDPKTRWTTGRSAKKGDEIVIELDKIHRLSKLRINAAESRNDCPGRMQIFFSLDGKNWGDPVYSGKGEPDFTMGFQARDVRFLRILNLADKGGFWSIHELQVSEK